MLFACVSSLFAIKFAMRRVYLSLSSSFDEVPDGVATADDADGDPCEVGCLEGTGATGALLLGRKGAVITLTLPSLIAPPVRESLSFNLPCNPFNFTGSRSVMYAWLSICSLLLRTA